MINDISDPYELYDILKNIPPDDAKEHHAVIREIFDYGLERRVKTFSVGYYETDIEIKFCEDCGFSTSELFWWACFLLFMVGKVEDIPRLCSIKFSLNIDTASYADYDHLVGAGVENTISYMIQNGLLDEAERIQSLNNQNYFDNIEEWISYQTRYFYEST